MPCLLWNINWDNVPLSDAAGSRMSNCTTTKLWQHLQEIYNSNWGTLHWISPTGSSSLQLESVEELEPAREASSCYFRRHVCIPVAYCYSAAAQLKALQVRCVISWPYFSHWIKPQAALWMPKPFFSHVCPLHSHLFHVTVHCTRPFTAHP